MLIEKKELKEFLSEISLIDEKKILHMERQLIIFKNKYKLSIIQGPYVNGGDTSKFEITIFNSKDDWDTSFFPKNHSDTVLEYCTLKDIKYYIKQIIKKKIKTE